MCMGSIAPRPQAAPPPPPPAAAPPVPQDIVSQVAGNRRSSRQRSTLAQGPGQNRTLLSGSLAPSGQGATLLGG